MGFGSAGEAIGVGVGGDIGGGAKKDGEGVGCCA